LIEMQGGTLWVESELDRGSKFSFTLPSVPSKEEQRLTENTVARDFQQAR
jgi:signal transduction histidine kinase